MQKGQGEKGGQGMAVMVVGQRKKNLITTI